MTPVSKSFFSEFYATFRCTAVQFVMLITARRSAVADKARHASVQSSVTGDMTKVFKILTDKYMVHPMYDRVSVKQDWAVVSVGSNPDPLNKPKMCTRTNN